MASSIIKEGRKGQFTVFVILGFVILVVILFTMFLMSGLAEENFKTQARTTVKDYLEASNIDYYVYTCVDSAVNDAVNTMAMQGGVFFNESGGNYTKTDPGVTHIETRYPFGSRILDFNVSYGIVNSGMCDTIVYENPPQYPIPETFMFQYPRKYNSPVVNINQPNECIYDPIYKMSGVVGHNNYTRLCYIGSSNSNTIENTRLFKTPCQSNTNVMKNNTIEEELAKQISFRILNCTNFSVFSEEGHNITLKGDPIVNFVFNQESFDAQILFPFEVKLKNKEPVLVRHAFDYSSKLRVPRVQNYILRLLREEVQNVTFNLTTDYPNVLGYDPIYMNVMVYDVDDYSVGSSQEMFPKCDNCDYKYDRMLVVEDELSKIGNQPLLFFSAIKNRRPVLDYIHYTSQDNFYDILTIEGETINIFPWGVDPDEKQIVKYSYQGWKEDYDEQWNFLKSGCGPGELPNLEYETLRNCIKPVMMPLANKWSTSASYLANQKDADFTVTNLDAGPHLLNVSIADESGLVDYQELKILVIDKPQIKIAVDPADKYPGQEDGAVSVEDYFRISNDGTTLPAMLPAPVSGTMDWEILWENPDGSLATLLTQTFEFAGQADVVKTMEIPKDPYDINTIKSMEISKAGHYKVRISLTLNDGAGGIFLDPFVKEISLEAQECIPYHDAANPFNYAYPYNTVGDPFYGSHSCCNGDITDSSTWTLLDGINTCYTGDWSGEKEQLIAKVEQLRKTPQLSDYYSSEPGLSYNFNDNYAGGPDNSVYTLEFERFCDNNRGNICAGDIDAIIQKKEDCPSPLSGNPPEPDGKCRGPDSSGIKSGFAATCENYFRQTFGSIFQGGSNVCNDEPKCSTISGYDVPLGKMLCKATCNAAQGCNKPINCQCIVGQCGAECDDASDFKWENTGPNTAICHSSCQAVPLCSFQTHLVTKCINPTADVNYAGSTQCLVNEGGITGCYTDVRCTSSGPQQSDFEPCQKGYRYFNAAGKEVCLHSSDPNPVCGAGGCNLEKDTTKPILCLFGGPVCDPIAGWRCS